MDLNAEQRTRVETLSEWVQNEAEFKGRTESDFLLIFLRFCNFDVELSKKTMSLFYQNRLNYPLWWANRDLSNSSTYDTLRSKIGTILINNSLADPLVGIVRFSNVGTDAGRIDDILKIATLMFEVGMRQLHCQLHGVIVIVDLKKCPTWLITHFLWPTRCWNVVKALVWALPVSVNKLVFINGTPLCLAITKTFLFFFPRVFKKLVHCFDSDMSKLGEVVPLELLPEEYGGSAGPMEKHEDAFIDQLLSFNDYFLEDMKFGYQE